MKSRFASFLILLIFFSIESKADSIEVNGVVSGIWNVDTVNVTGDIQIREVETLEIMPGTLVLFRGEFYFEVQGCLKAIGTETLPINFTIDDTTGFHNDSIPDGGWKQIRIEETGSNVDTTILHYCNFSYGKAVAMDSIHGYGGAVCIRNTDKVKIMNCSFYNNYAFYNGGAVYLENASIQVTKNHFESNRCGQAFAYYGYGGGLCSDWGEPLIKQNYFTQNSSTGIAGGLCVRFRDCLVSHNIFDNNYSALGGGFGILHIDTCNWVISNNLVINNTSLYFGAGISNNDCSPTYVNNTICNNHCIGGGGGLYCKDSVVPVLYNNIIFGNTQYGGEINQVYLWDLLSQPNFYFNNIQDGYENFAGTGGSAFYGQYENNLDTDPLFSPGYYVPEPQSSCVNAGNPDTTGLMIPEIDLAGFNRIVDEILDMGAYENQDPVWVAEFTNEQDRFKPNPNPAHGFTSFSFYLDQSQHLEITILNSMGQKVKLLSKKTYPAGIHEVSWHIDNKLPCGNYFAHIKSARNLEVYKIVVQ